MREILFKAKRIDNGGWVEGYYVKGSTRHCIFPHLGGYPKWDVDADTICQYTGLTDKNGNKIWENDEVLVKYTSGQEDDEDTAYVKYTKHGFVPWSWEYSCDGCDLYCELISVEVIGNIFDNADLMKE